MRLIDVDSIELIDKAYSVFDQMREEWDVVISLNDIDNAPTVDIVKHAHWINVELIRSFGKLNGIKCSCCAKERIKSATGSPNYCEECGAKMDEEVET